MGFVIKEVDDTINTHGEQEATTLLTPKEKENIYGKVFARTVLHKGMEYIAEKGLTELAPYLPGIVDNVVASTIADGGMSILERKGLEALLTEAAAGLPMAVDLAFLSTLIPYLGAAIAVGEIIYDIENDEEELSERKRQDAATGGYHLYEGTYASKEMPPKPYPGEHWVTSDHTGRGRMVDLGNGRNYYEQAPPGKEWKDGAWLQLWEQRPDVKFDVMHGYVQKDLSENLTSWKDTLQQEHAERNLELAINEMANKQHFNDFFDSTHNVPLDFEPAGQLLPTYDNIAPVPGGSHYMPTFPLGFHPHREVSKSSPLLPPYGVVPEKNIADILTPADASEWKYRQHPAPGNDPNSYEMLRFLEHGQDQDLTEKQEKENTTSQSFDVTGLREAQAGNTLGTIPPDAPSYHVTLPIEKTWGAFNPNGLPKKEYYTPSPKPHTKPHASPHPGHEQATHRHDNKITIQSSTNHNIHHQHTKAMKEKTKHPGEEMAMILRSIAATSHSHTG